MPAQSFLTIGKSYTDWGLGASVAVKNFTVGVNYIDTSKHDQFLVNGRDVAGSTVVGSVGVSF